MDHRCLSIVILLFFSSAISSYSPLTRAEETSLDEIVVRGTLRDTKLSETASSVSVISLDNVEAGVPDHLEDILNKAPNVNFSSGASRARFIQIRGIGERGQFSEPLNSSVGLILDGVDMSGVGTAATLFDIDQLEIFRGPQGTLYGANALAGLINITSNAPTRDFAAAVTVDAGEFDSRGTGVVVSGPLGDQLSGRLAWRRYRDDGFITNAFLGRSDTTLHDEETWRGQLLWAFDDASKLAVSLGRVIIDNGYDNFSLDNTRISLSDSPGHDDQTTSYGSVRWSGGLPGGQQINVSVGHVASDSDYGYDEDWTFDGFHPFGYSSTDRYRRKRDNTTLDLRILSDSTRSTGGLDWVAGVFALKQSVSLTRNYTFLPGPFLSDYDIDRVALYGQVTRHVSERTRWIAGLRVERHGADYADSDVLQFSPRDNLLGGRLQVEHDLANGALAYVGITRGYKAGGFNTDGSLDADLRQFEPESLWNAEVGIDQRWWDERLRLRASIFFMLRDDIQISTSIVRQRSDGSSEFIDFVGNGAEGTNTGAEFELNLALTDKITLFSTVGLLDTEFRHYVNGAGDTLDGREQAQAPRYQFHIGADFRTASGWFSRLEVEGRDNYFFSDSHATQSDAYELFHAALGYQGDRWSVRIWGRNLTDEEVPVRGFFFGNDPRDNYTARSFVQLGEPRRVGVSATLEW